MKYSNNTYLYGRTQRWTLSVSQMRCSMVSNWDARSSCRRSSPHLTITERRRHETIWPYGEDSLTRRSFSSHGSFSAAAEGSSGSCVKAARRESCNDSDNRRRISPAAMNTGGSRESLDSWLNWEIVSRSIGLRSCMYWNGNSKPHKLVNKLEYNKSSLEMRKKLKVQLTWLMAIDITFSYQNLHYVLHVSALQPYFKHTYKTHKCLHLTKYFIGTRKLHNQEKKLSQRYITNVRVWWVQAK